MKIFVEKSWEREVWGNHICKLKFTSESSVLYSKDIDYHQIIHKSLNNSNYYILLKEYNSILLYEIYRLKNSYDFVCIDFVNMTVRKHRASNELIEELFSLNDADKMNLINTKFHLSKFEFETIKIPFYKRWKKEFLFEV
ncbi:MAG: hypothetical protein RIQ33_245 [Bacteroidota bacterium]